MQLSKRSWGWYLVLADRKRFKIKFLWFRKGESCSKQFHRHRNELWLFLTGRGTFTNKDNISHVYKNDWAQVNKGEIHQFKAIKNTLVLEIQYGERCDEMDIKRL